MANSTRFTSGTGWGNQIRPRALRGRLAALFVFTLQLNACAAEPALPPGPEWKSGDLRRSEDGSVLLVPSQGSKTAPAATSRTPARATPKRRQDKQAVVSWAAPTTYANGKPISGPLRYKVHYGQRIGRYSNTLDAGARTQVTVKGLAPGTTYYFVVTAYTTEGAESSHSKPMAVRIEP